MFVYKRKSAGQAAYIFNKGGMHSYFSPEHQHTHR